MPQFPDEPIEQVKGRLLEGMIEFMQPDEDDPDPDPDYDCGYVQSDIDRCESIVDEYVASISNLQTPSQNEILKQIEVVVKKLNQLNAACDGTLIETDQREDLCQIILCVAVNAGLDTDDDVTENYREW